MTDDGDEIELDSDENDPTALMATRESNTPVEFDDVNMVDVIRLRQLQFPPLETINESAIESATETEWYEISDDQPDTTHRLPGSAKAKSRSVPAPRAKAKAFPVTPHFDEDRKCRPACQNTTALGSTAYA